MQPDSFYVIKNSKTGNLIGVDYNSGGYPFETNLVQAKIWVTVGDAKKYLQTVKDANYIILELRYKLQEINV